MSDLKTIEDSIITTGQWLPVDRDGFMVRIFADGANYVAMWRCLVCSRASTHPDILSAIGWVYQQRIYERLVRMGVAHVGLNWDTIWEILGGLVGGYWHRSGVTGSHAEGFGMPADDLPMVQSIRFDAGIYTARVSTGVYVAEANHPTLISAIRWINLELRRIGDHLMTCRELSGSLIVL